MALKLANNAVSTLPASITDDATVISVQGADAGRFPVLAPGDWHPATIIDAAGNMEVVRVTGRAGSALTIERAQEGTTAKAFPAGARIDVRITAGVFASIADRDELKTVAYSGSYTDLTDKPPGTTTATVGAAMAGASGLASPADGDSFGGVISGTSTMFKTTWGNIKAALTTLFDGRYLKLAGGALTGNLTIQKTFPLVEYRGTGTDKWWGYYDTGDGRFKLSYNEGVKFQFGTDGAIWMAQFGDLNARIENRAAAFANDRVAAMAVRLTGRNNLDAINPTNGTYEAPSGTVITGYVTVNSGSRLILYWTYRYLQLFDPVRGWTSSWYD